MSVISLDRRLRKIEASRGVGSGPWFFVWGRDEAEIRARIDGLQVRPAALQHAIWTAAEPAPEPRWASAKDLSDPEFMAIIETRVGPEETWPQVTPDPKLRQWSQAQLDDALLAAILAEDAPALLEGS